MDMGFLVGVKLGATGSDKKGLLCPVIKVA